MSLSNPTNESRNPATRWFEFSGKDGAIIYYDKEEKKNIAVPQPFTFIVLDRLAAVKGWHDPSGSGIISNEVRDTTKDVLVVRAFKGPQIAEGFYRDIKDKVAANGGHFVSSVYIAYNENNLFHIGNIQFKGAALNAWVEFCKNNKGATSGKAVVINGCTEGKKGAVTYKIPSFSLRDITPSTLETATDLDKELQEYLNVYLTSKKVVEQVAEVQNHPTNNVNQENDNHFAKSAVNPNTGLTQEEFSDLPF